MSINLEVERPIFSDLPDNIFMKLLREGAHTPQVGKIAESEIAVFCSGCVHLTPSNTCEKVDSNTQAINAESKKQCDLAVTNS